MAINPIVGGIGGAVIGAGTQLLENMFARDAETKARRRQRAGIQASRKFARKRSEELVEGPLFSRATDFLTGVLDEGVDNPLVQDFGKSLEAIAAERGIFFGGAPAVQTAGGLAAAAQQLRFQALPFAEQFDPTIAAERFRQQIFQFETPFRVASRTGAPLPGMQAAPLQTQPTSGLFGSAVQGGTGGFLLGLEQQRLQELQARRDEEGGTPTGGSPLGSAALSFFGQGLGNVFGNLFG